MGKELAIFALAGFAILVVFAFLGFSGNTQAAFAFVGPAMLVYIIGSIAWVLTTAIREDSKKVKAIASTLVFAKATVENAGSRNSGHEYSFAETVACRYADNDGCLNGIEATFIGLHNEGKTCYVAQSIHDLIDSISHGPCFKSLPLKEYNLAFDEILDVQIAVNEETSQETVGTISGRSGSALLGTVLFGIAGGIVAGSGQRELSSRTTITKKISSLALEITTSQPDNPYIYIHFFVDLLQLGNDVRGIGMEELRRTSEYEVLRKCYSALKGSMTVSQGSGNMSSSGPLGSNNIAEQLMNLSELLRLGALTQREFTEAKNKILGLTGEEGGQM
jgi:hypothetical protein